jgi:hypothetical protein
MPSVIPMIENNVLKRVLARRDTELQLAPMKYGDAAC